MKLTKKFVAMAMAMIILFTSSGTVFAVENGSLPKTICDFFSYLHSNMWTQMKELFVEENKTEFEYYISSPENEINHMGYFNFESVSIVSYKQLDAELSEFEQIAQSFINSYTNWECWECIVDVSAYRETDYLSTGHNRYIIYIADNIDGETKIMQVLRDKGYIADRSDVALLSYDEPVDAPSAGKWENPDTINVYYNGQTITVDFLQYCYIVLANEFGTSSYNQEARKAVAMCVKQYGWNRTLVQKYSGMEYDVKATTADQVYDPSKTPSDLVVSAVDAIWEYMMLTDDFRLFCSFYCASSGVNSHAIKNGGILSQTEANTLGKAGKTWKEILHYFYDNGTYNTEMKPGIIKIISLDHTEEGTAVMIAGNLYYHNIVCKTCGCIRTEQHDWVQKGLLYRCSKCAMTATSIPSVTQLGGSL